MTNVQQQVEISGVNGPSMTNNSLGGNNATQAGVHDNNNMPIVNVPVVINNTDTSGIPNQELFHQQQLGFTPLVSAFSPLGTGVQQSVKTKIVKGEYVDLVTMLEKRDPYLQHQENQGVALSVNQEGQIVWKSSWKSSKPKQFITSINAWISAFLVYTSIYLSAHPSRTRELLKYIYLIRTAASWYGGFGWRSYDQQFRARLQKCPQRCWAMLDAELWALYMTPSPITGRNFTAGIRPRGFSASGFRSQIPKKTREIVVFAPNSKIETSEIVGFAPNYQIQAGQPMKKCVSTSTNVQAVKRSCARIKHKCMYRKESGHGCFDCKKTQVGLI